MQEAETHHSNLHLAVDTLELERAALDSAAIRNHSLQRENLEFRQMQEELRASAKSKRSASLTYAGKTNCCGSS